MSCRTDVFGKISLAASGTFLSLNFKREKITQNFMGEGNFPGGSFVGGQFHGGSN